jgi:hypothetical protein
MKKYFVIKSLRTNDYYSVNENWDIFFMALEFDTKEEAITYGDNHSLGYCTIEEFYHFE